MEKTADNKAGAGGGSDSQPPPASPTRAVRDTLNDVAQGLLMMSESDRPIKAFTWGPNKTGDAGNAHDALLAVVPVPDPAQVTSLSVDDFFAPMTAPKDWWGDEEKETGAKFAALVEALKENLTAPEAFRIEGDSEIPVYIVGKDAAGTWSGIKTELVET